MGSNGWKRAVATLGAVLATLAFTASPATAAGGATRGLLVDTKDRTLVAFDPATNTITNRIPSDFFLEYAVRPDGQEIYATDDVHDRVVVVSTATMSIVASIPVRPDPAGVAFTPDSRRAYVSNDGSGSVTAIDTTTRQIIRVIPTDQPGLPAASPDGTRIYVATDTGTLASRKLTIISTATNTVQGTIPLTVGNSLLNNLAVSPNGRFVLIRTGALVDTTADTVVRTIPMGVLPTDFLFSPDSASIYLADLCADRSRGALRQISVTTGQTLRTLIAGRWPSSAALSPDATRLYVVVDAFRAILELNTSTGAILDTFGAFPATHASTLTRIRLSATIPTTPRGERLPPEPPRFNPCAP
ncbi:MAG TPA: YncE family protein [Actinophytocola sp.]|jgi:YVTN family beta-propeller protein|uniref:YncE family protein n=1 Tax=Actinophytocola sp. TaxID=1872138 RepID=UPI002DFEA7A2|nr:YncE family protein [Actinophytocola sp.]